jgi:hypothetical protein
MVKTDDAPFKNGPAKELTNEEKAAIHRSVARSFLKSTLRDAIRFAGELELKAVVISLKNIEKEVSGVT